MIVWSSKKLEKELASSALSEWDKVKYVLFLAIVEVLLGGPIFLVRPHYGEKASSSPFIVLLGGLAMALATYFGLRLAYRANRNIDDKSFIERFAILSVPVTMKFIVFFVPGLVAFSFPIWLISRTWVDLKPYTGLLFRMVFPFIMLWFYGIIAKSISRFGELKCSRDP